MKILIPDDISSKDIEKIKSLLPEIVIHRLSIKIGTSKFKIFIREMIRSRFSPYFIYQMTRKYIMKEEYEYLIDGKLLNEPRGDIDVFLASFILKKAMFDELVKFLPNLKWVHSTRTGVDRLINDWVKEHKPIMTSSKGVHTVRVAEFVIGFICAFIKNIPQNQMNTSRRQWNESRSIEFADCTIGILGTGFIGKKVAELAKTLHMKVIGVSRSGESIPNFDCVFLWDQLGEVLKQSDVLVISLPETRETTGKIGKKELNQMKVSSYVINVGRAKVIKEGALVRALRKKTIAGAALDVFTEEPLPKNHPFYRTPNLILTHHSAWSSPRAWEEIMDLFCHNTTEYIAQSALEGRIDIFKGY